MVVSHYCRVSGYFTGLGVGGGKWSGEKSYLFRLNCRLLALKGRKSEARSDLIVELLVTLNE